MIPRTNPIIGLAIKYVLFSLKLCAMFSEMAEEVKGFQQKCFRDQALYTLCESQFFLKLSIFLKRGSLLFESLQCSL